MRKSYLKWSGGKSRILDDVLGALPAKMGRFFDPFGGSGVVALNVKAEQIIMGDMNSDLIECHGAVAMYPNQVLEFLEPMFEAGRESYYDKRTEFRKGGQTPAYRAALFIYLNRHGFNGMCRYNLKGEFNVPVGKGSIYLPEQEIFDFGVHMAGADVGCADFSKIMAHAGKGDTVYCDPPYIPTKATLNDINYTGEVFDYSHQVRLKEAALEARDRGATVLISNHDIPVTRELYKDATRAIALDAHRSISSNAATRGKVGELIAIYK